MRTVPSALVWEILTRGRWQLLMMTCVGNVFPLLLFTALRMQGEIDFTDPAYIVIHLTMVQINMFVFGAGVMMALGPMSRLSAYPVRTSTLVMWHLLPGMVLMALEMIAASAVLNALYNLHWPLWGPSLFAAVALAALVATMWLTEKSAWLPWAVGLVGSALGLWFKTRHGPLFQHPQHFWNDVALMDGITLLAIAAAAYAGAVYGVSRSRRGETWPALGIVAWFERQSDSAATVQGRFTSPAAAQAWFEWRKKGWAMPACVIFASVMAGVLWLIFNRDPKELIEGLVLGGGAMMGALGLIGGLIIGHSGSSEASSVMGHFLATRPLTNPQFARIILWNAARSLGSAWLLWVIPVVCLSVLVMATGAVPMATWDPFLRQSWWWYLPATLLASWTVCSCLAAITLTGRSQPFTSLVIGGTVVGFATNIAAEYALTLEQRMQFWQIVFGVISAIIVITTVWLFAAARRRQMITLPVAWGSLAAWCALVGGLIAIRVADPRFTVIAAIGLAGVMTLAVAPFAATPLALAWNRTR